MMRALLLCLLLVCGCAKDEGVKTPMPINDVPKEWMEQAQKELPDVKFDTARKLTNGNIEVRGKNKHGKVQEVEFNSAGVVVDVER